VTCRLDRRKYPTGQGVTDEEIKRVNLKQKNRTAFMVNGITPFIPPRAKLVAAFIY